MLGVEHQVRWSVRSIASFQQSRTRQISRSIYSSMEIALYTRVMLLVHRVLVVAIPSAALAVKVRCIRRDSAYRLKELYGEAWSER